MKLVSLVAIVLVVSALGALVVGCKDDKPAQTPGTGAPVFANTHCPIMGTAIVPEKVPASLIRQYKGQKVAFCCAGCPAAWDALTDEQKDAKLAAASPKKP